jgi:ABC-type dipeptide/oligopeptide/nickel transport system permease component
VSVSLAFGALIPIEVVCGSPGFGLLAWQAAQGRDLQLLINMTVVVTVVTIAANSFSDFFTPATEEAA